MIKYTSKTMDVIDLLLVIRVNYIKTVILTTIQKSFLSSYKNIILIFSLVRTAFLSSYKNIVLFFSLVRTAFLPSYKNVALIFSLVRTAFCQTIKILIVCFYHFTYEFESESTLYGCLNVKELLSRSSCHI